MKAFVDWVLAQRQRLVIMAVVAAPLLPIVTGGLMALETARRGLLRSGLAAVFGILALLMLAVATRGDLPMFAAIGVLSFGSGVLAGELIRRAGNLTFAFQAALLVCFLTVLLIVLVGPDTGTLFAPATRELVEVLRASGASEDEIASVVGGSERVLLSAAVFSQLIGPLLLGYWWTKLAGGERTFGAEFRKLALGRLLGGVATLVIVLGLAFNTQVVQNFSTLALFGFLFQGLAVFHAWAHAKRWHVAVVAVVYLLLVTPLTVFLLFTLSVVGLADNWFNLRARLAPQA